MAKDSSSSDRIGQIEERVLAHKWLASIACAVVAVLVLLPVYAERVAEPADANAGTGCWGRIGIHRERCPARRRRLQGMVPGVE